MGESPFFNLTRVIIMFKKSLIALSATVAILGMGSAGSIATGATNQSNEVSAKATTGTKATQSKRIVKANRLTSSHFHRNYWLIPVNKETFKQSRRKQLKDRSVRKAKKRGQT